MKHIPALVLLSLVMKPANAGDPAPSSSKSPAAGTVENRVKEGDLTTVKLTPEAEQRLQIKTVPVQRREVARRRLLPGEIVLPPGGAIVVAAPVEGTLELPADAKGPPQPGAPVRTGQTLMLLVAGALPSGEAISASDRISLTRARADTATALAEAEGAAKQAQVKVDAAQVKVARAQTLLREEAGSQKAADEAAAELELVRKELAAAENRRAALARAAELLSAGGQPRIPIDAPVDGLVRALHVAPGQLVPAGAPLLEIISLNRLWVRVPIYAGDAAAFQNAAAADVQHLGRLDDRARAAPARKVDAPPAANPLAASVDLFFELQESGDFRPGERVSVRLATADHDHALTLPLAVLLYDMHGGTWVYERTAPQTFVRRRIELRDIVEGMLVIQRGVGEGAPIVTDGAAELFGVEFGAGK